MKQETKKPLYKVLNEQRTQGEWKLSDDKESIETADDAMLGLFALYAYEKAEINAQYVALAVNNLHILAGALHNMLVTFDALNDFYKIDIATETIKEAKEALNRIS